MRLSLIRQTPRRFNTHVMRACVDSGRTFSPVESDSSRLQPRWVACQPPHRTPVRVSCGNSDFPGVPRWLTDLFHCVCAVCRGNSSVTALTGSLNAVIAAQSSAQHTQHVRLMLGRPGRDQRSPEGWSGVRIMINLNHLWLWVSFAET